MPSIFKMKKTLNNNTSLTKTTVSSNQYDKNKGSFNCFARIFQLCYAKKDDIESHNSLEKFKANKLPLHYASSLNTNFPNINENNEQKSKENKDEVFFFFLNK